LILKCYPRLPKNSAADVNPNGSELSYLLYYASTRRSKLQKVGSFLERKTASDVSRFQSARVHVTLQILTALLENKAVGGGSGFALIAPYVLRIIREILSSTTDISLIEASLGTWDSFCRHQDEATLKADHEYRELYEDVVSRYTGFAHMSSLKKLGKSKDTVAVQDAIRLREAGLGAIRSILESDTLATDSGRQLHLVVPAILSNMHGRDDVYLTDLMHRGKKSEDDEREKALQRRMSLAATRTHTGMTDTSFDADPRQAEGTAQDADEIAGEEIAVLALDCLRIVFSGENRALVRDATVAVLKFLADVECKPGDASSEKLPTVAAVSSWATKLFTICTAWIPVQDRFILMVTAVEALVRLSLKESEIKQQLLYTTLIDHILYSDLNLIGLSVMDILLSLMQQILRVLQLSGSHVAGRNSTAQVFSSDEDLKYPNSPASERIAPSAMRMELAEQLKLCIAHLGTHVYYTDQISDMLFAILLRLKPNPAPTGLQNPVVTAAAIEEPQAAVTEVASNISLPARDRPHSATSGFFSFETARQIALEAVRDILRVSNSKRSLSTGGVANSRSKVPIAIWEGTQWLLRDPSSSVRRAYVDALSAWLKLETTKADARIKAPKDKAKKKMDNTFARRALSNASNKKDKQSKKDTNTFLQLLHLAVFEDALNYSSLDAVEADMEMLMLHYLLSVLVQRLGVNAVQSGLPMVFALQEQIFESETKISKVRLGSLVHGYFWVLSEEYDFDVSIVAQEIFGEIRSRRERGLWISGISMPPRPIEQISAVSTTFTKSQPSANDTIKSFDSRNELVERVSESYARSASPAPSAPGSPGRTPGHQRRLSTTVQPMMDRTPSSYLSAKVSTSTALPEKVRNAMMETWTKEGCLAAIAASAPKSISLSGTQSTPSQALIVGNHRQLLAAANTLPARNASPIAPAQRLGGGQSAQAAKPGLGGRLNSESPARPQC